MVLITAYKNDCFGLINQPNDTTTWLFNAGLVSFRLNGVMFRLKFDLNSYLSKSF